MAKLDFLSSIVLVAFGAFVVVESWRMPRFDDQAASLYSAPGFVPGVLGLVLVLCGFVIFLRSLLQGGARLSEGGSLFALSEGGRNLLITLALGVVYVVLLIGRMPFWLATTLFAFAYTAIFEYRAERPARSKIFLLGTALVLALGVALAVTFIFERIFLVRMP